MDETANEIALSFAEIFLRIMIGSSISSIDPDAVGASYHRELQWRLIILSIWSNRYIGRRELEMPFAFEGKHYFRHEL